MTVMLLREVNKRTTRQVAIDLSPRPPSALAWLGLSGLFELTVETAGVLSLPLEVIEQVGVVPGDILSLERWTASLSLEIYHEFLADNWRALSSENRWHYLDEFLRRPLTAIERGGTLRIPPEVFPLLQGEKVVLQVMRHGLSHKLFLWREGRE